MYVSLIKSFPKGWGGGSARGIWLYREGSMRNVSGKDQRERLLAGGRKGNLAIAS